jgi:hypothetical protein
MHGPLNVKQTLFAPIGYRNPTIQTVAATSPTALSSQESTLIVSLTLNMSNTIFKETLPSAENGCNISHHTQDWCLPTLHNPAVAFPTHYVILTQ